MTYHNCKLYFWALGFLLLLVGWVRPSPPNSLKPKSPFSRQLDHMVVEINGEPRIVRNDEEIVVVRGDRIAVKEARLRDPAKKISHVNVVGYKNPGHRAGEDRGFLIDTNRQLIERWSEESKGRVWAVTATSREEFHGAVYLRLIRPTLKYAVLSINGKDRVLRDGERAAIASEDMVKVKEVVTNLSSNEDVLFQIFDADPNQPDSAGKAFEVRFLRDDRVFARIPLVVEE